MRDDARRYLVFELALSLYGALLAFRLLDEADVFFHLSLGRAVLEHGSRVVPEPTAFRVFTDPAIAPEWLWSVASFLAYRAGGFAAISWLGVALGAAVAFAIARFGRACWPSPPSVLTALPTVLVLCVIQSRISPRPELFLLCALPSFLMLLDAHAQASGTARLRTGLATAALVCVWAQAHGSFVLAPPLFVLRMAPRVPRSERADVRTDGLTLALLLAAMGTSAYGFDIAAFITSHAAGDAPRFIAEMSRPTWASMNPLGAPSMLAYDLLLLLALTGAVVAKKLPLWELSLSVLGIALLATANRFLAEAALLALPLASFGTAALAEHFALARTPRLQLATRAVVIVTCAGFLFWTFDFMRTLKGPLGRAGVYPGVFPMHAGEALAHLPQGSAVLTDYVASAPVGFLSAGRLRTFVDGRTPLYFDGTDFAIARDMFREPQALRVGIARFGARAAIVRRDSPACAELMKDWSLALVEPRYTTFVAVPGPRDLSSLRPCGTRYIAPDACKNPAALELAIAAVHGAGDRDFADFLRAERSAQCGGDSAAALETLTRLSPIRRPYGTSFARTQVDLLLAQGRWDEAARSMESAVRGGDAGMLALLTRPAAGNLSISSVERVLMAHIDEASDSATVAARAALAEICIHTGNVECVRFQATRAALFGQGQASLAWLAQHHPSQRVRRDAARWLEVLATRAPATAIDEAQP